LQARVTLFPARLSQRKDRFELDVEMLGICQLPQLLSELGQTDLTYGSDGL
jgi:hypothetical protein